MLTPHEATTPNQTQPTTVLSLEEMIEQRVGLHINCTQIVQGILASVPSFFDSQQTFISVFAHAQPTWHCRGYNTTTYSSCSPSSNICSLSKSTEWAWDSGAVHTSIISELDLECSSLFITGLPATCYFVGCVLGGLLFAALGDSSLGRKNLLVISSLVMSLAALASAFSPNIWVYSGLRFLSGVGRASIVVSTLVLVTERVGKRWRMRVVMLVLILFSLGILALTGIAYVTRHSSWRTLYLCTSIPGILCSVMCYFFLYESPRWLFVQGREKEAMDILKRIGSKSEQIVPSSSNKYIARQQRVQTTNPFTSLKILFMRRWAVKRLLASMVLGFGIGLMYFGMFLSVGNLGFNIYLTMVFNAILNLSSYFLTFLFWVQRYNRRSSLLGFCTISGAISMTFAIACRDHEAIRIGLELVSLSCACMAYNIILIYMLELFPTCVRNSASSLVRQAMILGSVFGPVLILVGSRNMLYSYGVFGLAILFCGFSVCFLPETRGKVLSDTMEEQENGDNVQ